MWSINGIFVMRSLKCQRIKTNISYNFVPTMTLLLLLCCFACSSFLPNIFITIVQMASWFTIIVTPILVAIVASVYVWRRGSRVARNAPSTFLRSIAKKPLRSDQRVLCCAGASITHGRVSFNWVNLLDSWLNITTSRDPSQGKWQVVNGGVNGDLAWNLLQRLQPIIDCKPNVITVLVYQ
jgi:hypothetical protein